MNKSVAKKIFWMCFTVALSVLTIWALLKQNKSLSLARFVELLSQANIRWIIIAIISAACYVIFEAVALCSILNGISHGRRISSGIIYSTADVYFSAITPSATGGQPASAYFMLKDGIPGGVASATLVLNLVMYNAAIVFLGILAIIISPKSFFAFKVSSKVFIVLGFVGLTLLSLFFISVLRNSQKIFSFLRRILEFFASKKIIHRLNHYLERLNKAENDFENCYRLIDGKNIILFKAFFWNVIQRASQIFVPALIFISLGGPKSLAPELFSKQCLITIGYNYVPIPGALGIADYLMIDGFSSIMSKNAAFELDMISRGITFYICVTLSGLITLFGYFIKRKKHS